MLHIDPKLDFKVLGDEEHLSDKLSLIWLEMRSNLLIKGGFVFVFSNWVERKIR